MTSLCACAQAVYRSLDRAFRSALAPLQAVVPAIVLLAGLSLTVPLKAAEPAPPASDAQSAHGGHAAHGVHGMVLFGENALFASHLPLYAHPHDWQVLLRLRVRDAALAQAIRTELRAGRQLTLEPERFDLLRLDPSAQAPLKRFKGRLYRGHFERGGALWQDAEFEVERTLVFRRLSADTPKPAQMQYFAFRDRGIVYLVHRIHGRPDFDHIVSVRGGGVGASSRSTLTNTISLPRGDRIESAIGRVVDDTAWLAGRQWRGLREIYFETADLR